MVSRISEKGGWDSSYRALKGSTRGVNQWTWVMRPMCQSIASEWGVRDSHYTIRYTHTTISIYDNT